jgi:hypothetical protein
MACAVIVVLAAFLAQAYAQEQTANGITSLQQSEDKSVDEIVDKMVSRAFDVIDTEHGLRTELDGTTMAKGKKKSPTPAPKKTLFGTTKGTKKGTVKGTVKGKAKTEPKTIFGTKKKAATVKGTTKGKATGGTTAGWLGTVSGSKKTTPRGTKARALPLQEMIPPPLSVYSPVRSGPMPINPMVRGPSIVQRSMPPIRAGPLR